MNGGAFLYLPGQRTFLNTDSLAQVNIQSTPHAPACVYELVDGTVVALDGEDARTLIGYLAARSAGRLPAEMQR